MATLHFIYAIIVRLRADAAITAIVGSGDAARIFHGYAPAKAKRPYLILDQPGGERIYHMGGDSGHAEKMLTVYSIADDWESARDLARKARQRLSGFKGTITDGADTLVVNQIHLSGDVTDAAPPRQGSDLRLKQIVHDYTCLIET